MIERLRDVLRSAKERLGVGGEPIRDPRLEQLASLGQELRDLTNHTTHSLYEVATRLWTNAGANLQLHGPPSPSEIIAQLVDDACAAQVRLIRMLPRAADEDLRRLVDTFNGAVRGFELAVRLVLDGFKAAEQVDASLQCVYDEFCARHQSFIDRYETFARSLANPIVLVRPKRLDTMRLGVGLGPPSSATFAKGERKEALVAVRKILALASAHVLFADGYVDADFLALLDDKLAAVKVDVLTTDRGLQQTPSFKVIATAHNQQNTGKVGIRTTRDVHDRYLVVDNAEVFHLGASIKDAGSKVWSMRRLPEAEAKDVCTNILPPIWTAAKVEL